METPNSHPSNLNGNTGTSPIQGGPAQQNAGPKVSTDLQEHHRDVLFLQVVSVHGRPLHHQPEDPALVVKRVVQLLLLAAL